MVARNIIITTWMILVCILFSMSISIDLNSSFAMKVNGESVKLIFCAILVIISIWFTTIAYGVYNSKLKYTLISSFVFALLITVASVNEMSLFISGELITYKYLIGYGLLISISIATVVSTIIKMNGSRVN